MNTDNIIEKIINKTVLLNIENYKIIRAVNRNKNLVSLFNKFNKKVLRHKNSFVKEEHIVSDNQFLEDSSFRPVIYNDKISFFAINKGIEDYCICYINGKLSLSNVGSVNKN